VPGKPRFQARLPKGAPTSTTNKLQKKASQPLRKLVVEHAPPAGKVARPRLWAARDMQQSKKAGRRQVEP
jgi:hypothetical protein